MREWLVTRLREAGRAGINPSQISSNPYTFFLYTLVTGPRRSLCLKLSDTRVYEPHIRARLGTASHFFEVVVLILKTFEHETREQESHHHHHHLHPLYYTHM